MTELQLSYCDLRGLMVPEERVQRSLEELNISEVEFIHLLGMNRMKKDGYFIHLLEQMVTLEQYLLRNHDE